jgi:FAD-dependent monooxygenase
VNRQRDHIKRNNDGTQPAEPGQRCSQIIFEAWLKSIICSKAQVNSKFGWTYTRHVEAGDGVTATFTDAIGAERTIHARYLVGCDGGSSQVRKNAGLKMLGGQM